MNGKPPLYQITDLLPSALDRSEEIEKRVKGKRLFAFLDYDGTMTPIVEDPERAFLSERMRDTVRELSKRCTVAVVSGRDIDDVQRRVGVDGIFYAGDHGFEISGPRGFHMEFPNGAGFSPIFDHAEQGLKNRLGEIAGAFVERKRFSIAVHYRMVTNEEVHAVEDLVDEVLASHSELTKSSGKKVFEVKPKINWHKGKAVLWLLESLEFDQPDVLPVYIGDDTTDEDAFTVLRDRGINILVKEGSRQTAAQYGLEDPDDVQAFLRALILMLDASKARFSST